jgi:hypothetical protein
VVRKKRSLKSLVKYSSKETQESGGRSVSRCQKEKLQYRSVRYRVGENIDKTDGKLWKLPKGAGQGKIRECSGRSFDELSRYILPKGSCWEHSEKRGGVEWKKVVIVGRRPVFVVAESERESWHVERYRDQGSESGMLD